MGLWSDLLARLQQHADANAAGQLGPVNVGQIPVVGRALTTGPANSGGVVGLLNDAGLGIDAFTELGKALTGGFYAGVGGQELANQGQSDAQLAQQALGQGPLNPVGSAVTALDLLSRLTHRDFLSGAFDSRAAAQSAAQSYAQPDGGDPFTRALAANEAAAGGQSFTRRSIGVGLANQALNLLNYAGPLGETGSALRGAETLFGPGAADASLAARAGGTALETLAALLHGANAPYQGIFAGLGAIPKGPSNILPAIGDALTSAFTPAGYGAPGRDTFHLVQQMGNDELLQAAAAGDRNAMARLTAIVESPGVKGNVGKGDLIPGVGTRGPNGENKALLGLGPVAPVMVNELDPAAKAAYDFGTWAKLTGMEPGDYANYAESLGLPVPKALPDLASPLAPDNAPSLLKLARDGHGIVQTGRMDLPLAPELGDLQAALRGQDLPTLASTKSLLAESPLVPAKTPNLLRLARQAQNAAERGPVQGPIRTIGPVNPVPDEALPALEEAAAKAAPEVPDLTPPQTPAPDLPTPTADRASLLAGLSNTDRTKLVSLAYNDALPAMRNAINKYGSDSPDLIEAALNRIQTGLGSDGRAFKGGKDLPAQLAQRHPDLAAWVAALPDEAAATADNVDIPSIAPAVDNAATIARGNAAKADLFGDAADQLPKPIRPLGGDIAAGGGGGGGMGLLGYPGGLNGPIGRSIMPSLYGAAGGAALGGAHGLIFGDPNDRLGSAERDAAIGGALGGTVGGGLGAAGLTEPLGANAQFALRRNFAPSTGGIAEGGVGQTLNNVAGLWREIKKTAEMVPWRNALGAAENVAAVGGDVGLAGRWAYGLWRESKTLLPALEAAGEDPVKREAAFYAASPPELRAYGPSFVAAVDGAAGSSYDAAAANNGYAGKLNLAQAMAGGVAGALGSFRTVAFGLPSVGLGLLEGATLKGRAALQRVLTTFLDVGARRALAMPVAMQELERDAPAFIQKVAAVDPQLAATLDPAGRFDPSALPQGTLQDDWRAIQQHAAQVGGQRAVDAMGDFTSPTTAQNLWNTIFPGGSWNIQQGAVLARQAARHPALATQLLGGAVADYHRHLVGGDPQNALTIPLSDQTPGLGLAARALNGGAPGVAHVSPVYPFSPVSGETLDLPRQLGLLRDAGYPAPNPNQGVTGQALAVTNALGLADNPLGQELAYKFGGADEAPSSPSRLAGLGTYLDFKANQALGMPLKANPIAALLAPTANPLDTGALQQQLNLGLYQDPAIAKAGADIIYRETGKPASDPSNAHLLAQLRDHKSALYARALDEGLGAKAAQAVASETLPVPVRAETQTQADLGKAQQALLHGGIPFTPAQRLALLSGDLPTGSAAFVAALDREKQAHPILRVGDAASPEAQAQVLLDAWRREWGGLDLFPAIQRQQEDYQKERLGLLPPGTAGGQQALYDQLLYGQRYGLPGLAPGLPSPNFDPTPLYDLMQILHGGR